MALSPDVRPLGSSGICSFHICIPIGAFHFTHNSLIKIEEIWLFSVIGPLTIFEFLINIYIVSRVLDFCNRNTLVLVLCVIEELIYNLQYWALLYYAYLAPVVCSKKYSLLFNCCMKDCNLFLCSADGHVYLIQKFIFIYKYNLDCSTIYIFTPKQMRLEKLFSPVLMNFTHYYFLITLLKYSFSAM